RPARSLARQGRRLQRPQALHADGRRLSVGDHTRGLARRPQSRFVDSLFGRRPGRVRAAGRKKKDLSFANEFWLSQGAVADWPYFARWHYRSHQLAYVRRVVLLWHRDEAVGVCVFASPAAALRLRSRYFGLHKPSSELHL